MHQSVLNSFHETDCKTDLHFQFILNASASSSSSADAECGDVKLQTFNAK